MSINGGRPRIVVSGDQSWADLLKWCQHHGVSSGRHIRGFV